MYEYRGKRWTMRNHINAMYGRTKLGSQGSITTDNQMFVENVFSYHVG